MLAHALQLCIGGRPCDVQSLLGFDIIPKMDWPTRRYVCINYRTWTVIFQLPKGKLLEFLSTKLRVRLAVIPISQAKKDLVCGVGKFLIQLVTKEGLCLCLDGEVQKVFLRIENKIDHNANIGSS